MVTFLQRFFGQAGEFSVDECTECGESIFSGATRCDDCLT